MLLPNSSCVCIPCFKSVAPWVCLYYFWPFLGLDTEMGVSVVTYMYFKHFPDYIDSKYIWVHGSNSLSSSVFIEIPFLAFLALHRQKRRCGQVEPSHVTPRVKLCIHTKF